MASVVFIIRVPYEESSKSLETEEENKQTMRCTEDKHARQKTDDQNVKEVKSKDKNEANIGGDTSEADQTADDVEALTGPLNLAEVLENQLRSLNVQGDSWAVTNDKKFYQVIFLEKTVKRVENILERLTTIVGIGKRPKSSVSIIPTSVHIQPKEDENGTGNISTSDSPFNTLTSTDENQPLLKETSSMRDQFKKSIKSRLTVEQVVGNVNSQALLTFDFVMFTILASFIAAVGLVEDNAVVLVASMLVSPLMGPILAGTFGTVIKNKSLRNTGLKTELCGLIISVTVGFLFGFICGPFGVNGASWDSKKGIWPTHEMTSRGMTRGLWVGVSIALPSGAGVALSVLGGNTGSLVGVAISASLLPPAVNSGMLLAYSIISTIKPPALEDNGGFNNSFNNSTLNCRLFKDNSYVPTYSCDMGKEAVIMAIISFVLTIVNIMCILITATAVLKIKEVTPKVSSSNATQTFWTKDIKVARKAYETHKGNQATNLLKEWKEFRDSKTGSRDSVVTGEELANLIEQVEETEDYQSVIRRTPTRTQNPHQVSRDIKRLVSKAGSDEDKADNDEIILENHLRTLQTYYTAQQTLERRKQPHISTIFRERRKNVREFHVVETENPHVQSVVRVRPPTEESNTYSVTTETGV